MAGFNPRAREGRDTFLLRPPMPPFAFQSTRPRGARPRRRSTLKKVGGFNPRAREGRDWCWRC